MSGQGFAATFPPTRSIDNYYSKGGDAIFYGLDKAPDATYDKLQDDFLADGFGIGKAIVTGNG